MSAPAERLPSPPRGFVFAALLGILSAFGAISIDMYLPALPGMQRELATDAAAIQWTLNGFFLGFGLSQLVYGPLADRFGRKAPLFVGCLLYIAGSIGCALATDVFWLAIFRLLQGIGGAAGSVISRAIVRDVYDRDHAAKMFSMLMLLMGAAPMFAPSVGGLLLEVAGWRAIFWTLAGFGVIALLLSTFLLRETLPTERRDRRPPGQLARAYASLLTDSRFIGYAGTGAMIFGGLFVYISGTPAVFIDHFGLSPRAFAVLFGCNVVGMMIMSTINSRFVTRFGVDRMLSTGLWICICAAAALVLFAGTGTGGIYGVVIPLFLLLASFGLIGGNTGAGALQHFPHMAGAASALAGVMPFILGSIAGTVLGLLSDGTPRPMALLMSAMVTGGFLVHRLVVVRRLKAEKR
ncbi:Bcr/CflA family multidrug efflux MFS transporter [Lacibacterium aquatile]|uniref:Bcr/CflA family efflux transporter n=1 Tax=Lacibacterium aquatile TaxID=1168082 RepID=A0ABW5DRC0_9PROT